jgi:hypothetical protein
MPSRSCSLALEQIGGAAAAPAVAAGARTGGESSSSTIGCRPNCAAKCSGHQPSTVSGSFAERDDTPDSIPESTPTSPLTHAACSGLSMLRRREALRRPRRRVSPQSCATIGRQIFCPVNIAQVQI